VFIKSYDEQFLVTVSNGSQIVCTAAHKFLTPDGRWVELRELGIGDQISAIRGGAVAIERAGETRQADGSVVPRLRPVVLERRDGGSGVEEAWGWGNTQGASGHSGYSVANEARVPCVKASGERHEEESIERVAVSIIGVEPVGVRETWDCTVEDDSSYVGNSLDAHNSMPNVQALPREGLVKRLYKSRFENGWVLQRDYSGLEVRVLAAMSRDPILVNIFNSGGDAHFRTQEHFFNDRASKDNKEQRTVCKQSLFGRLYGQGDKGLFDLLRKNRVMSPTTGQPIEIEECKKFNLMIDELYEFVKVWVDFAHDEACNSLKITTAFGYCVPVPILSLFRAWRRNRSMPEGKEIAARLRHSQNYPIQGCASDYTIYSAYEIRRRMMKARMGSTVFLIVHDAIYVDCVQHEVLEVARIMQEVMDHVPDWIESVLPGINTDWMKVVPIIGEQEIGINAKDALKVKVEPSADFSDVVFDIPKIKPTDGRLSLFKDCFDGVEKLTWNDHRPAVRKWLDGQRLIF
jgi:hypothetical protein